MAILLRRTQEVALGRESRLPGLPEPGLQGRTGQRPQALPQAPRGRWRLSARPTHQSPLSQPPRPADSQARHQLQPDRGGTSAITFGFPTTISAQAVRKSGFRKLWAQVAGSRNKGRANRLEAGQGGKSQKTTRAPQVFNKEQ